MKFFKESILKIWLFFMIILLITFAEGLEDKQLNLKVGFDLIPRENGNPLVRIRDFEDVNLRKFGRKAEKSRISIRADSSLETEENQDEGPTEDKESVAVAENSDSEDKALGSTRGINPDEFEPERSPRIHSLGKQSDTETE